MGEGKGIGLVLAGGGGKGAYQVGVLKVLQEQGLLEDVTAISGASIGAVNAMLYSMNDMERMYQAWNEIDMDTVFDIDLNMLAEKRISHGMKCLRCSRNILIWRRSKRISVISMYQSAA